MADDSDLAGSMPPLVMPVEHDPWAPFQTAVQHQQRWGMPDAMTQIGSIASKTASIPGIMTESLGRRVATAATDSGDEGIRAATDLALTVAGGGAFGAERNAVGMGIRAYHASPHDFDRFDMSKIGTGEGSQSYGKGLYFADNPAVSGRGGTYDQQFTARTGQPAHIYETEIDADPDQFLHWDKPLNEQSPKVQEAAQNIIKSAGRTPIADAPVHDQVVKAVQAQLGNEGLLGVVDPQYIATQKLRQAGVPGIKYLDQGSRVYAQWSQTVTNAEQRLAGLQNGTVKPLDPSHLEDEIGMVRAARDRAKYELDQLGSPTHNYVIFDDKLIDIMKKYGIAGIGALPGLGAYHYQTKPVDHDPFAQSKARGGRVNPANIDHAPTEAQKEAGNYAKDHISVHGLDIAVENARGKTRSGVGRDGKPWSVKMPAHYGYIKGTVGRDKDHVDCYIGPHLKSPRVYVIDQHDADTGRFDEHKCMIGFGSKAQAEVTYHKGFSDGRGKERLGHMREMSVDAFKNWLKDGDTSKPAKAA